MARYALRNQHKIKASLGEEYLKLLIDSLDQFFRKAETIDLVKNEPDKDKHLYLLVPSVHPSSEIEFQFVLIRKMYDVYNLAYYSSIG